MFDIDLSEKRDRFLDLAKTYCTKGKPQEAIILCQQAIKVDPFSSAAYALLGHALSVCSRFDEAIVAYRQAIFLDGQDVDILLELAKVHHFNHQFDVAIKLCQEVISKDHLNPFAYWILGNLLRQKNQESEAIIYHSKLLEIDWNSPVVEYCYQQLVAQGCTESAVNHALEVLRRIPSSPSATSLIVFFLDQLIETNQLQDAANLSIRLLHYAPNLQLGYLYLSKIFALMGRTEWAKSCHMFNIPLEVLGGFSENARVKFRNDQHPSVQYFEIYPEQKVYIPPSFPVNGALHPNLQGNYNTVPSAYIAVVREGRVWGDSGQTSAVFTQDDFLLEDLSSGSSSLIATSNHLSKPYRIDARIMFLSTKYSGNYCHWTSDVISRISLLKRSPINIDTIDYFVVSSCTLPFQRDMLVLAGIPENKIIESSQNPHVSAKEVVIPSLPSHNAVFSPWAINALREDWLPLVSDRLHSSLPQKIYLTRVGVAYRKVINEAELMTFLEKQGFSCVTLSDMPVIEQIATLAAAKIVISPHGAALTNAIFMPHGSSVIEIFPKNYMHSCYHAALSQIGIKHYSFWGDVLPNDADSLNPLQIRDLDDLYVNLSSLEEALKMLH